MNQLNRYYVYGFYNKDWKQFFYIGKGTNGRYKQFKDRSVHVKRIIEKHDCESRILSDGLMEKDAYVLEELLKMYYRDQGHPIIDYENTNTHKNQREGITKAKAAGKYRGRKPRQINEFEHLYGQWKRKSITMTKFAELAHCSRPTLYKLIGEYEKER